MMGPDDELLGALREALVLPDVAPSEEELAGFRNALAGVRPGGRRALFRDRRPAWRPRLAPRGFAAAGVVLLAGLGAFTGGVAADSLPGPVRSAAYDLGLPVSSPSLVAAESAESALTAALGARDRATVLVDVPVLEQRLAVLGTTDRAHIEAAATTLLAQAAEFLATTNPIRTPEGTGGHGTEDSGGSPAAPSASDTTEPTEPASGSSSESPQTTAPESSPSGETTSPTTSAPVGGDSGSGSDAGSSGSDS